jgi:hypothetical protein
MTPEVHRQLNHLAGIPSSHVTMKDSDIQAMLLETGGNMLACGRLYDFKVTPVGAGVSKVTLQLTNP